MALSGTLIPRPELTGEDTRSMLRLMQQFYENIDETAFYRDLQDKDTCILLRDEDGVISGFSTQKRMTVEVEGKPVQGIFSGDTIIHPDSWGSLELHRVFARHFIGHEDRYWFLISKGYKTYKMLPSFFKHYYPSCLWPVPAWEQQVMHTYARTLYPDAYNPRTGVLEYPAAKDYLRPGVAEITPRLERDRHVAYFLAQNPGWRQGHDLVCLALLRRDNMTPRINRMLFGTEEPVHD